MILCTKLKHCLCKIVTKFNVTKSRLHCTRNIDKHSWRLLWNLNHLVCAIFFVVNMYLHIRNVLIFKKQNDSFVNDGNILKPRIQLAFKLRWSSVLRRFDGCQWQFFIKFKWNTITEFICYLTYLLTVWASAKSVAHGFDDFFLRFTHTAKMRATELFFCLFHDFFMKISWDGSPTSNRPSLLYVM